MAQKTKPSSRGDLTIRPYKQRQCVVLFVDIRASTEILESPKDTQLHKLNIALSKIATSTLKSEGAPAPTFAKSTGDGLMLLWEINKRRDPPTNFIKRKLGGIIKFSLALSRKLNDGNEVRKGIGLAIGDMTPVRSKEYPYLYDYLGWAANYAAKLQGVARPHGVVIDRDVLDQSSLAEDTTTLSLSLKQFATLQVKDKQYKSAYATEEVQGGTEWTCLAWPGFASAEDSTSPLALNTMGIGVVTHEGISGKIDRLQIWDRRWRLGQKGDEIEVLIDDFDAIQALHAKELKLARNFTGLHEDDLNKVCADIRKLGEEFLFIPIRCGLNALVARSGLIDSETPTYLDAVNKVLEQSGDSGMSPVGLYNHFGTSMPLLVRIGLEQASLDNSEKVLLAKGEDVFGVSKSNLKKARKALENLGKQSGRRLFRLYPSIKHIHQDLGDKNSTLKVVLGGGRWLCAKNTDGIDVVIPSKEVGYLWVEGAAIFDGKQNPKENPDLATFLVKKLLAPEAQAALRFTSESVPYPACPVTQGAIKLAYNCDYSKEAETDEDVKMIFESDNAERLSGRIKPRIKPIHPEDWHNFWEKVKDDLCESA